MIEKGHEHYKPRLSIGHTELCHVLPQLRGGWSPILIRAHLPQAAIHAHATQLNPLSQQKQYIAYGAQWLNAHSTEIVINLLWPQLRMHMLKLGVGKGHQVHNLIYTSVQVMSATVTALATCIYSASTCVWGMCPREL